MAESLPSLDSKLCIWLVVVALGITSAVGCEQPGRAVGAETVVPTYSAETGRLDRISYDRNKDGKPDAWLYLDGTTATRAELDENFDGAIDRWEEYQGSAPTLTDGSVPRGQLVKAEQSTRFDGKVSRWERYDGGRLATVEEDTTGDGRPDKWETWADGSLAEVALDTKGAGKPDRRLVYPPEGGSPQLLVDSGDGQFKAAATEP